MSHVFLELLIKKKAIFFQVASEKISELVKFQPPRHPEGPELVIYISKFMVMSPEIPNVAIMWHFKYDHITFKENAAWKAMDYLVINYLHVGSHLSPSEKPP